jgi:hypothetical protein
MKLLSGPDTFRRFRWLLITLTVVIIALSINRLTSVAVGYLQPDEFLRWADFNAMVPITIAPLLVYWLIRRDIERRGRASQSRWLPWLEGLFLLGVILSAISSGLHEFANYLDIRYCGGAAIHSELCNIIIFNDDVFSHLLYYLGLITVNLAVLVTELLRPSREGMKPRDLWIIAANAGFIALGIFANLAFEPTALDIVGFGVVLVAADIGLWLNRQRFWQLPFTFYLAGSYTVGTLAAVLYKLFT